MKLIHAIDAEALDWMQRQLTRPVGLAYAKPLRRLPLHFFSGHIISWYGTDNQQPGAHDLLSMLDSVAGSDLRLLPE